MTTFEQVLVSLGGNAMLLVVLGFLARSLIQSLLAKDLKRFETDLGNVAESKLEHLRSDLRARGDSTIAELKGRIEQTATEHRVRFSKLHEERAHKIAEIYKRLVEQSTACQRFVMSCGEGENSAADYSELNKGFSDLYLLFETSKIYLPEHVCASLESGIGSLRKTAIGVWVYGRIGQYAPPHVLERRSTVISESIQAFESSIPEMKAALVNEFRALLGVEAVKANSVTTT